MLEGNQHAQIASRWIDASDEGDQQNRRDGLRRREYEAGESDQSGAGEKQTSQLKTRCNEAGDQRQRRSSKQRGAGDDSDQFRAEADGRKVDRENNDGKTVAESAQRPCAIQTKDVRWSFTGGGRCHPEIRHSIMRIKQL